MQHNRRMIALTLRLSQEDNQCLEDLALSSGLKKSEYLRSIIQGISLGNKLAETMSQGQDVKFDLGGYGYAIKHDIMEGLLKDVMEKMSQGLQVIPNKPQKNLRYKRMKTMAKAS